MNDTKEQLKEVRSAITSILMGGQSYKIGSRSLTRADLSELYAMKKELESVIAEENSGGLGRHTAAAVFGRR